MVDHVEAGAGGWQCAPREVLLHVFKWLPLKERCQVVGAVCSWWRAVLLEAELLGDLILNNIPIFVIRSRHLESFLIQHASFIHWLERRAPRVRGCILQAERWEDDGASLRLRVATAQVLGPHLTSLKLVSTGGGQVTSTFLQHGQQLRQLQIDYYGAGNRLQRQLTACTALTSLWLQCSSGLERYESLPALSALRDLFVADSDWRRIPREVCSLPSLTRLALRFADFEGSDWLPLDSSSSSNSTASAGSGTASAGRTMSGGSDSRRGSSSGGGGSAEDRSTSSSRGSSAPAMAATLLDLSLHGCHITQLPVGLSTLTGLTSLCLDRNSWLAELPEGLLRALGRLQRLSLEGCRGLQALGEGAAALPLKWLNLQESGVEELPPGTYTSTLEVIFWGSAAAALPTDRLLPPGYSFLPGCQRATQLKEVYLAGKMGEEDVQLVAGSLFEQVPSLQKVCVPASGLSLCRAALRPATL